jgi:hypothetical protein
MPAAKAAGEGLRVMRVLLSAVSRRPPAASRAYAIRLQMAATLTMSSTLQPRERSQ